MKKFLFGILFLFPFFTTAQHISGPRSVCTGGTVTLTDALPTSGGTWSASNTNVVFTSQGSASAQVTGVTQGTAIITYSTGDTFNITVNTYISPVTGTPEFCITGTAQFSDATTGGVWSSSNTAIGTIGSASGTLTGIKRGSLTITYTLNNACITGDFRTFNTLIDTPVNAIGYTSANICINTGTQFTNTTPGGTWGADLPSIATVSSGGYVTGLANGTTGISYTLYNTCGITQAAKIITVNIPAAPINGPNNIYTSTSTQYNNIVAGGSWYLDDSTNASINTSTGILTTSTTAATVVISYIVNNSCGSSGSQLTVNISYVNPSPGTQRVYDSLANIQLDQIQTNTRNTAVNTTDPTYGKSVFVDNTDAVSVFVNQNDGHSVFTSLSPLTQLGKSVFVDNTGRSAFLDTTANGVFVDSSGTAALMDIIRQNNQILAYSTYGPVTIVPLSATNTTTIRYKTIIIGGYTTAANTKLLPSDLTGTNSTDNAFIIGAIPAQVPIQSFSGTTSHTVTAVNNCVIFTLTLN